MPRWVKYLMPMNPGSVLKPFDSALGVGSTFDDGGLGTLFVVLSVLERGSRFVTAEGTKRDASWRKDAIFSVQFWRQTRFVF